MYGAKRVVYFSKNLCTAKKNCVQISKFVYKMAEEHVLSHFSGECLCVYTNLSECICVYTISWLCIHKWCVYPSDLRIHNNLFAYTKFICVYTTTNCVYTNNAVRTQTTSPRRNRSNTQMVVWPNPKIKNSYTGNLASETAESPCGSYVQF